MDSKFVVFWLLVPLVLVAMLILVQKTDTDDVSVRNDYQALRYYQLPEPKSIDDFSLKDHRGKVVDITSLQGQLSLVFFGFTRCPDVCPTTLSILNMATSNLKTPPRVILVSVDPGHDTTKQLAPYITGFNESFIAYTGSVDEVKALADQLDVVFERRLLGPGENWTVDHTSNIIVINEEGQYQGFIRPPHQVENISTLLALLDEAVE